MEQLQGRNSKRQMRNQAALQADSRVCIFTQLRNCSFQKGALARNCILSFSLLPATGGKQTKRSDQRISANVVGKQTK